MTGKAKLKLTVWHKGGYHDKDGNFYTEAQANKMFSEGSAVRTQWKGGKIPVEVPGPGRKAGVPTLKRVEGGFQNQYGVTFTAEQKKALENSVRRSNYARDKQIKAENAILASSGQSPSQLRTMGKGSDFIVSRQSRSLQGFRSMAEYDDFMKKQARIQSGEYLNDRTRLYKANHMQALKNVFGDDAKDVIMKIRMMKPEEYRAKIQKDEFLEVGFVYDPSSLSGKLNQIRQALGMKTKEEDLFSELE
jgi:hypothetical protein